MVVQASLPLFSPTLPLPPPRKKERKKIKTKGKKYTFVSQHELAMAYSPSVQYGFYKRLESSLISGLSWCVCGFFLLKSRVVKEGKKLLLHWKNAPPSPTFHCSLFLFGRGGLGSVGLCLPFLLQMSRVLSWESPHIHLHLQVATEE